MVSHGVHMKPANCCYFQDTVAKMHVPYVKACGQDTAPDINILSMGSKGDKANKEHKYRH